MMILKWGFIGCGEVTEKKSGPAFSEVEGSSVVAVMSRSEQRARTYAITHSIPKWYTDAQQLIDDPDVNAVYVATPPSSHATFAIMAMKAGKPVYVEKPLASSYDDCARVNSISPGWIDTTDSVITGADAVQQPAGRVGKPEDIAELVLFLYSAKAGFITGENICVDGGMTRLMIYHGDHGWTYHPGPEPEG